MERTDKKCQEKKNQITNRGRRFESDDEEDDVNDYLENLEPAENTMISDFFNLLKEVKSLNKYNDKYMNRLWYSTKFEQLVDSEYWMNMLMCWKRNTVYEIE